MNNLKRPVFIDVGSIFRTVYIVLAVFAIYSFVVGYIDVSASIVFDYAITYVMYAEVIFGLFTASAWVCLNVLATKLDGLLLRIPNFKFDNVVKVWELYFLAWRQYTCVTGFVLALLLVVQNFIVG